MKREGNRVYTNGGMVFEFGFNYTGDAVSYPTRHNLYINIHREGRSAIGSAYMELNSEQAHDLYNQLGVMLEMTHTEPQKILMISGNDFTKD